MSEKREYLKRNNLRVGAAYAVDARSFIAERGQLSHAIWDGEVFHGTRSKFGNLYMCTENHWDTGAPHGTIKPYYELGLPNKDGICKHYWPLDDKTLFSPTGSCDTETQILCSEFESIQEHTLSRTKQSKSSLQTGDEGSDTEPTSV